MKPPPIARRSRLSSDPSRAASGKDGPEGGSVEVAQLGDVFVGAVAVNLDLRQVRLDPLELLVGQVDVSSAEVLLDLARLALARASNSAASSSRSAFRSESA